MHSHVKLHVIGVPQVMQGQLTTIPHPFAPANATQFALGCIQHITSP
jgi:hypothetical protein